MIHLLCLFGCTLASRPIIAKLIYLQSSKLLGIRLAKKRKCSRKEMKTRQGVVLLTIQMLMLIWKCIILLKRF